MAIRGFLEENSLAPCKETKSPQEEGSTYAASSIERLCINKVRDTHILSQTILEFTLLVIGEFIYDKHPNKDFRSSQWEGPAEILDLFSTKLQVI